MCGLRFGKRIRKLQVRIVKAVQKYSVQPVSEKGLIRGLSRMKRKFHVRFLGEGMVVTPSSYPTKEEVKGKANEALQRTLATLGPLSADVS